MSLPKTLTRTERLRLAGILRYLRRAGWEPTRPGTWRQRATGRYIDWGIVPEAAGAVIEIGPKGHSYDVDVFVTSVGQAADLLATMRIIPARFSDLYVAGAMTVAEKLVEAVSVG